MAPSSFIKIGNELVRTSAIVKLSPPREVLGLPGVPHYPVVHLVNGDRIPVSEEEFLKLYKRLTPPKKKVARDD
jgi:hypothetical protein